MLFGGRCVGGTVLIAHAFHFCDEHSSLKCAMGDSSYRLNFDQGKKNEIQHHS
jgi:hypothetical protein